MHHLEYARESLGLGERPWALVLTAICATILAALLPAIWRLAPMTDKLLARDLPIVRAGGIIMPAIAWLALAAFGASTWAAYQAGAGWLINVVGYAAVLLAIYAGYWAQDVIWQRAEN